MPSPCSRFTDELAAAAGRDRVEYLLDLIGPPRIIDLRQGRHEARRAPNNPKYPFDTARLRNVHRSRPRRNPAGRTRKPRPAARLGIAAHRSFLTYVAAVVEVEVHGGKIRIPRVDIAVDAGRVINPDRVKSQFEGAAVFGTSIAMMGEITAADGRIQQSNFDSYPVARMQRGAVSRRTCTSWPATRRRPASASRACRRSRRRSAMRSSRRPENAFASCPLKAS